MFSLKTFVVVVLMAASCSVVFCVTLQYPGYSPYFMVLQIIQADNLLFVRILTRKISWHVCAGNSGNNLPNNSGTSEDFP